MTTKFHTIASLALRYTKLVRDDEKQNPFSTVGRRCKSTNIPTLLTGVRDGYTTKLYGFTGRKRC